MPSRWEILLAGPPGEPVPLAAPLAVVSGWLDDPPARQVTGAAGQSRRSGHDDRARKWACGPLRDVPATGTGKAEAVMAMQVRLLDDSLADRFRVAAGAGSRVRLGRCDYEIAEAPSLAGQVSWQALRRWSGARAWQVRFVTPACFRRGNRTSPWPSPETVARGLIDRWQQLHPQTAPALPGPGAVWVSDIDGRSEVQILSRNVRRSSGWCLEDEVISGFTGRIRYVCDRGTEDEAAAFDALMSFAAFAGVGSHTTYGFGVIRAEPTWQPPTTTAS